MDAIYGHGANFLKDIWYDGGAGPTRTMADTRSKQEHQLKRKRMAHLFSQKSISEIEPLIAERAAALFQCVSDAAKQPRPLNMRRYVNYFTIDVITAVLFGETTGCLERGNDIVNAKTGSGEIYRAPLIQSLHDGMRLAVPIGYMPSCFALVKLMAKLSSLSNSAKRFEDIVYYHTTKGLSSRDQPRASEFEAFIHRLKAERPGKTSDLPFNEILAECSGMMNAGSDTTSTALCNAIYVLSQAKHKRILEKLREELSPAFETAQGDIPSYDDLARVSYLRACIDEVLRLRPSSAFGLPREVPEGGRVIAGQFVAGGVSVSVPTYSILHNADIFADPEEYRPERWRVGVDPNASSEEKAKLATMKKAHVPFSIGPRACIGRNIAYFELTLVIGVLMYHFDFEFRVPEVEFNYPVLERLNANPDELFMIPRKRATTGEVEAS